jgi:hypothetical protein
LISKNKDKLTTKRASYPDEDQPEQSVQERYRFICKILVEKGKMIAKFKDDFINVYIQPTESKQKKTPETAAQYNEKWVPLALYFI